MDKTTVNNNSYYWYSVIYDKRPRGLRMGLLADRYQSCGADNTTANGLRAKVDQSRMSILRGRAAAAAAAAVKVTSLYRRRRVRLKIHIKPLFPGFTP